MEDSVPFASREYFVVLALLLFGRGMDFLSTWVATPNLALEANPIAKKLGWKWGALVNLLLSGLLAAWPLPSVIVVTTSLLVAARNFKSAWAMRALGENEYRAWVAGVMTRTPLGLYLACLFGETLLTGAVGAGVAYFAGNWLVLAIGLGVVGYAIAVAFYTLLSLWRMRRLR
ncbi:MAG: hypothetical protein HZA89_16865 [Verrucomicrobia bacterium]|nr:hypothetical protein [Verrucomicrobiota bacterium]